MKEYNHKEIETKWQEKWKEEKLYETPEHVDGKENFYTLVEFAYPSGDLHVGHWYAFAPNDMWARFHRMQGKNVLFPMGFDAFGLPAENAAIKRKLNPRDWTYDNIERMRAQLRSMGTMFDWSREVVSSDPAYYRWTQWLFLQLLKKRLAYQAETTVNWCPSCKTVLANEQVIAGHCERCGSEVQQRQMKQWMLKITDYADRLVDDLETLDWPEPIKDAQRAWIGKSKGAEIDFTIVFNLDPKNNEWRDENGKPAHVSVFTTRPDTLFGATYLVLSPEHPWVAGALQHNRDVLENVGDVEEYIKKAQKKTELERQENKEKTGVELKGIKAINPGTKEEIPVWVADYVLAGVGTGAIMAVPAHDERDFAFAKKFDLPIREVISGGEVSKEAYSDEGLLVNSGEFDGMDSVEAREKMTKAVGGEMTTTYRMRDWVVSRQRYWGCPIPIVHCEKCGAVPVSESDLPVELPEMDDFKPRGDGKSPLAKAEEWVSVSCPSCGGVAKRETDTLDTFVDSSWYFLRYTDPHNTEAFASKEKMDAWMPIDFYSGGAEHTTMHLLYSRFFHKALFDLGLVSDSEPYKRRMNRALILGPDGNKMSKSKGNVIDPDDAVERLGADTVRMYLAFIGPYNEIGSYPWNPDSMVGARRFVERLWKLDQQAPKEAVVENTETTLHQTIKKVTESLTSVKMNTGVAALMECMNVFEKEGVTQEQYETLLKLCAPFAPHVTEEIWRGALGHDASIHCEVWPTYDENKLISDMMTLVIQIDGVRRAEFEIDRDTDAKTIEQEALVRGKKWVGDTEPKKLIYVPGKLVNIVTGR